MWGGWLWLCRPAASLFTDLKYAELHHTLGHLLAAGLPFSMEGGALTVCGSAGGLWLWKKLTELRAGAQQAKADEAVPDYAAHFGLSAAQLEQARTSRVCTVHHNGQGHILAVEINAQQQPEAAAMIEPEIARAA